MLNINSSSIVGATFTVPGISSSTLWICIGYGQDPVSAANYVVGITYDASRDSTTIKTHLMKDVLFRGKLPDPKT